LAFWNVSIEFHDVAVRIRHIDLRPRRQIARRLEAFDAMTAQMLHGLVVAPYTNRQMPVARIDVARTAQCSCRRMHDQMQLSIADLIPGAAEIEWRTRQLAQPQDAAVKRFGAFDIGHSDADVME